MEKGSSGRYHRVDNSSDIDNTTTDSNKNEVDYMLKKSFSGDESSLSSFELLRDDEESSGVGQDDERTSNRKYNRLSSLLTHGFFSLVGWSVAGILILAWVSAFILYLNRDGGHVQSTYHGQYQNGKDPITIDHVLNGTFQPRKTLVDWIPSEIDGQYVTLENNVYKVRNWTGEGEGVLLEDKEFQYNGNNYKVEGFTANKQLTLGLVVSDKKKLFRYSSLSKFFIYHIGTKSFFPLHEDFPDANISLAIWSPSGDAVAFVWNYNVYLSKLAINDDDDDDVLHVKTTAITNDGSDDVFYGFPDWVQEEEIFQNNIGVWWSSQGTYLSYLKTNHTSVPTMKIPLFAQSNLQEIKNQGYDNYPEFLNVRYPKAGEPNPISDVEFFNTELLESINIDFSEIINDKDRYPKPDDRLIIQSGWLGDNTALIKQSNREGDFYDVILVDLKESKQAKIVRSHSVKELDGGWVEHQPGTIYIPANPDKGRDQDGYIDTILIDGYSHIGYFSPIYSKEPSVNLTFGEWEVVGEALSFNDEVDCVYYIGTKKSSIERHLYATDLSTGEIKSITNTTQDGYYSVKFSTLGGYVTINYDGPLVPWQKIVELKSGRERILETNEELNKKLSGFNLPTFKYSSMEIPNDDDDDEVFTANTLEIFPGNFDPMKKYPVLFHVYGGPGSQTVSKQFSLSFESYVASSLGYIVVTIDGRGTGYLGRKFRLPVRDKLGIIEAKDQINYAKELIKREYIDELKIGIWGWSYGGFMTLKVIELDKLNIFKYGMAVAPVTDWRFYDSIYTERYMHQPNNNKDGYLQSTISNTTSLSEINRFLIIHGTGDDNVHFQNTLTLLDRLDLASVENYDLHVYPDSDHSIRYHNANKMVYHRLGNWLHTQWSIKK